MLYHIIYEFIFLKRKCRTNKQNKQNNMKKTIKQKQTNKQAEKIVLVSLKL